MKNFLYTVTEDLVQRFGNNLSDITIVFPGKRASIFMNEYLIKVVGGPVWAPKYATIDEMFQKLSEKSPSEPIRNICELYKVYREAFTNKFTDGSRTPMSLDRFYGWGEILMADFDEIDKHKIDVKKLFSNANDLAEMDNNDFVRDEQLSVLRDFFSEIDNEKPSELKQNFKDLWAIMPDLYSGIKKALSGRGLMYKGALYRQVAEEVLSRDCTIFKSKKYVFIGFNVLDTVEIELFRAIKDNAQCALFYWDYDNFYLKDDHEAGLFMRENLKEFPDALPNAAHDNLLTGRKKIRYIATNTDNAQVRYIKTWLQKSKEKANNESAIVLCDESLIRSTLHAIPTAEEEPSFAPDNMNVTMGFPMPDTPIHGYFMTLLDLQISGYDTQTKQFRPTALERLRSNPFYIMEKDPLGNELLPEYMPDNISLIEWLSRMMEDLGLRYKGIESPNAYEQLYIETTYQLYLIVNQFTKMIKEELLPVERPMLRRLIRQALQSTSIPFHGEMDNGLQVMGLLEARNLDFKRLLMLSVEEGFLPKKPNDTSLIPFSLKQCFGLNTQERKVAVFAYYFYRILQRAEDITLMFNENSSGASQREQSRFLRQLLAETELNIETIRLEPELALQSPKPLEIEKDGNVMLALGKKFDKGMGAVHNLSPSALGTYLTCPVLFYYQNVADLNVPRKMEDGIDNILFGTIFHDSAELFYRHLEILNGNKNVTANSLTNALKDREKYIAPYVELAFWVDFFKGKEYDGYTKGKEREAFLEPFLSQTTREDFYRNVSQLYEAPCNSQTYSFTGLNLIVREVIIKYLVRLLECDKAITPFRIYGLEKPVHEELEINTPSGIRQIRTGGRIDRMDIVSSETGQVLRIVDYKTGKSKSAPKDVASIFVRNAQGMEHYYLQTFLYAMLMRKGEYKNIRPCLFYIVDATDSSKYNPTLKLGKELLETFSDEQLDEYKKCLTELISEIFDPSKPFKQAENKEKSCEYCDFKKLCGM